MKMNKEQALAMYNAMCSLNNVGAAFQFTVELSNGDFVFVKGELDSAKVTVKQFVVSDENVVEVYDSQAAFATAYGVEV